MTVWRIPIVIIFLVLNIHCAETRTTTGILIPAGQQGLAPYESGGWGGGESVEDDARFAEEQGPLCIGLAPPEDAYLPIEPEPDVSEDAEDERDIEENASGDALADVSDTEPEELPDIVAGADSETTDLTDTDESDALSGMMRTFSADASDAESDGDSGDTSSEGSGIPLPPAPELEEEEPYDCTEIPQTCVGADAPESFALFDFQPQSCGFQATYGLSLYKNHVTMVALLAAW